MSRFEAEKFCSKLGLNFGLPQTKIALFLKSIYKDAKNTSAIWDEGLNTNNVTKDQKLVTCTSISMFNNEVTVDSNRTCEENLNFVCTLPEMCHNEICKCLDDNEKCGNPMNKTPPEQCEPVCTNYSFCGLETAQVWGFRAVNGDKIVACNKLYFISKLATLSYAAAHTFCCTKNMRLANIESADEKECLTRELQNRSLAGTEYWTSGSSGKCNSTFVWCSHDELVDFDTLETMAPESNRSNQCLSVTLDNSTSPNLPARLTLKGRDCLQKKRAICVAASPKTCKEVTCIKTSCPEETFLTNGAMQTGAFLSDGVLALFKRCGKQIFVQRKKHHMHMATYYKAVKGMCSLNHTLVTLDTEEKRECFGKALKDVNTTEGLYWVSAMSLNCPNVIKWCNGADNPLVKDDLPWKNGEPTRSLDKECVAADFKLEPPYFSFLKVDCQSVLRSVSESLIDY